MLSTPPRSVSEGAAGVSVGVGARLRGEGAPGSAAASSTQSSPSGETRRFHPPMSFLRQMRTPLGQRVEIHAGVSSARPGERELELERELARDRRKENERKELVGMILESIANVPVAVERIHTNERLRAALKDEMGAENVLLHRFFDREATRQQEEQEQEDELELHESLSADNLQRWGRSQHSESAAARPARALDLYGDYARSVENDIKVQSEESSEEESSEDSSDDSSGFGSEYENDLAEAVNQLCMSDDTLTAMEKMLSTPIAIASNDANANGSSASNAEEVGSARISSSPQSSICLGVSPGNASLDGEPVLALWPRQPNQFAFTQEEDGAARGEDEVYSEMVSSVCEDDETFGDHVGDDNEEEEEEDEDEEEVDGDDDDDDSHEDGLELEDIDREEKVFEMEEQEDHELDDGGMHFHGGGTSDAYLSGSPLKLPMAAFREEEADEDENGRVDASVHNEVEDDVDNASDEEEKEYETFQLRIIREKNRTGFEANEEWVPRTGSVVGGRYKVEMAIGEAVFSRTYKCVDTSTNQSVCLKIIKNNKEYFDQGVDEIRVLEYMSRNCKLDDRHLVRLLDYFYFREHLIIVTELLRDNLYEFSRLLLKRGVINYFSMPRLKKIAIEVLEALDTLHSMGLVHCDLKPENILIRNFSACAIKVIDFGSACFITDELTSYVQSRSYRAPEVILGLVYDQKIDLWSLGCVLAEMFTGEVLFRNDSEQTLLARILATIGPIPARLLAGREDLQRQLADTGLFVVDHAGEGVLAASLALPLPPLEQAVQTSDRQFLDFLRALLQIDPMHRLSARQALTHPWLQHGVFSENRI